LQRIKLTETAIVMRGVGGSRDLRQVLFPPLPATGPEVETAAGLIGGQKYLKRQALEGVVKSVTHPKVLYLATHGFVLPDQERIYDKDSMSLTSFTTRGAGLGKGQDMFDMPGPGPRIENPMLRCGLALAGANRRDTAAGREDVDDGILTGMEIAGLDLWGTKLVVLSACQTGLGDVQQGEGVMGLRRAFLLAGARRVLATLWMVPDQQTRELMNDFLTRWKAGKPAVDALREAQISMIARLREDRGHAHPFYWAAFTMTGDWR
jgi:CHAT domain-containing protein